MNKKIRSPNDYGLKLDPAMPRDVIDSLISPESFAKMQFDRGVSYDEAREAWEAYVEKTMNIHGDSLYEWDDSSEDSYDGFDTYESYISNLAATSTFEENVPRPRNRFSILPIK